MTRRKLFFRRFATPYIHRLRQRRPTAEAGPAASALAARLITGLLEAGHYRAIGPACERWSAPKLMLTLR
jgi:hypothetical protein